jgi:uncharacterized membrane protein
MTNVPVSTWLLLAHIVAALWLAAGSFAGAVVRAQVRRAGSFQEKAFGLRLAWRLNQVFTIPGGIIAGLLGVALVNPRGWTFGEGWVHASLAIWVLMLITSLVILAPRSWRVSRAVEAALGATHTRNEPTPELQVLMRAKWPGILADVNALGIVVLTLLMVLKPF